MNNTLYYTKKAKYFEEALPVGNGRLGAMVYGDFKTEKLVLNEDTLWSGYPKDLNTKDAKDHLNDIRKAIFSGELDKAEKLGNSEFHGHWCESYLPFGNLMIQFTSRIEKGGYARKLDISKGVACTSSVGLKETVFVSRPADMIVVNLKSVLGFS